MSFPRPRVFAVIASGTAAVESLRKILLRRRITLSDTDAVAAQVLWEDRVAR